MLCTNNGGRFFAEHPVFAEGDDDFKNRAFPEWKEDMDRTCVMFSDVRLLYTVTRVIRVDQEEQTTDIVVPQ
ncbi:MAG: hypothetical protein A3A96_02295 [Candidatus Zambryskibacteria bacterium RIFCSPLOWO2_01_FULL_39_39]|uniref:Uncharacterized protein n=1 Tax=Candidatus Zambryskibacteria bacterium RIFCSPLOWO2_01_FULL_39_39 TaxID=1802758 RepID=A0A1G2TYL9_9BACT|nr:MAG: hypothetical protein A2644_03080 [Candidatus Zambryskibacteria bacterium RIFCSPHIGHO2_01_FULL_39_63]OHB02263.1 MAG: hypothetical protein A3A96_02295 [Candidatus Zambryskibacteria bacterium RIFCSPLOWO2_01_FULL_39_39]